MEPICAVCKVSGANVECALCRTPHHEACWKYNYSSCSVYGCVSQHHNGQIKAFQDTYRVGLRMTHGALDVHRNALHLGWLLAACLVVFSLPSMILWWTVPRVVDTTPIYEDVEVEDDCCSGDIFEEISEKPAIQLRLHEAIARLNTPLGLPVSIWPTHVVFFDGTHMETVPFSGSDYGARVLSHSLPTRGELSRQTAGTCR